MKKVLCIICALAMILSCTSCGVRSFEALVEKYVEASLNGDAEKIVSLMPESLVEVVAEEEFDGDKEDMIYECEDMLDDVVDMLEEYDVDLKTITYEITDVEDMDNDDIDDIEDEYRKARLDIKEGKYIEVELCIPIEGEERTNSIYFEVVKIGSYWYLISA